MTKCVTWPHEVVYTMDRKAAVYSEISVLLFVQTYLSITGGEKERVRAKMASHLKDIMGDSELYGWEK